MICFFNWFVFLLIFHILYLLHKDENGNIVIKPEPEPTPTPTPTPDPVPGTGDSIALGLVGVLALVSACYVFKKNA